MQRCCRCAAEVHGALVVHRCKGAEEMVQSWRGADVKVQRFSTVEFAGDCAGAEGLQRRHC